MWISKPISKYKVCHSINLCNTKTFFLLTLIFRLEHFIHRSHHWNCPYSCFCFRFWNPKLTLKWIVRSCVISKTMVNIDCSFLHINIVPSDAYCLTDSASSSKQKYKKRIPMEEKRILRNIINKFSLLLYCQCSSTLSSTTISFFHLGISSIYRISSYYIISYCQLKCRSQYSIDTLQSIYLQSFVRNQIRIEK